MRRRTPAEELFMAEHELFTHGDAITAYVMDEAGDPQPVPVSSV